jgi:hypothetical protein
MSPLLLPLSYRRNLVLEAGIEPARLSARDFKSLVSTYFTIRALFLCDDFYFKQFTVFVFVYYTLYYLVCQ